MSKKFIHMDEDNQFSLSIGDLMAALLLIFVLLLIGTMLKLQEETEKEQSKAKKYTDIAIQYESVQHDLYDDLFMEFEDDLTKWKADIDKGTLTIRFKEPDVLFDVGQSKLKNKFKNILTDFFPRYITVLQNKKYINHIDEIRIEGHTSSEGTYFRNMKLSQDRTRSVLEYCLGQLNGKGIVQWTKERSTANGLSSVKPIASNKTKKGREQNRRVEFTIRTDAEKQIRAMLEHDKH